LPEVLSSLGNLSCNLGTELVAKIHNQRILAGD